MTFVAALLTTTAAAVVIFSALAMANAIMFLGVAVIARYARSRRQTSGHTEFEQDLVAEMYAGLRRFEARINLLETKLAGSASLSDRRVRRSQPEGKGFSQ